MVRPPKPLPAHNLTPPQKLNLLHLLFPALHTTASHDTFATTVRRSPAPYWTCSPSSPTTTTITGPGLSGLHSIHAVFTTLYGPEPLTLGPEEARVATCGGLLFGLWNGRPYPVTEKPGFRDSVAARDPGENGMECLGDGDDGDGVEDDMRLSYMFGVGEDSWVSGGMTEVRRCED
ncbi:hypothetical protein CkaCkLH20_09635 [Colletotrichum karsti]|uniref:Uncharacterized protein n=1 Tax=Colletotrichum karsti TaxID=1095194 RepID=A0A9P6HWZ8_9PEZI|nr:uncharacterized protein CkaCkLH20_09635 [Colletotrichum karsti]KAF9872772.1 hypothetical protein CkaCkLH20_09635 [Colletotrichum karsti]